MSIVPERLEIVLLKRYVNLVVCPRDKRYSRSLWVENGHEFVGVTLL